MPIKPPTFDYELMAKHYLESNRKDHFPLTVQSGSNSSPSVSVIPSDDVTQIKNRMFYTTDRNGSRDIWMRDLDSTVNIPIIEHPAEQHHPAITADGRRLAYVSEDRDPDGDIRIVSLKPGELIERTLEGGASINLWDESTLMLSEEIEKRFRKEAGPCRGRARETAPVWHPAGRYLLFVSDRCTPGIENLWIARQDGLSLTVEPLTREGAVQPAFSGDGRRIAFVAYPDEKSRGEIFLREEAGGRTVRLPLPRGPANDPYIYLYPALSADGGILHYVSIREDTNGNGYLDPNDFGAIYKVPLAADLFQGAPPGREIQLVENSNRLFGLARGFLDESVLYSAERAGAVNIYMTLKDGVVPRQADIEAQYRLARNYRDAGRRRYFLALDAVRFYFGETLEYLVYQGALLADQLRALPARDPRAGRTRAQLATAARENEYAGLERDLLNAGRGGSPRILRAFIARLESRRPCAERCRLMKSAAMERLARELRSTGDEGAALETARRLNREDPGYFRADRARKLEGELELERAERVPAVLIALYNSERTGAEFKEEILGDLFSFYYKQRTPDAVKLLVDPELNRKDLPGPMRAALHLARARAEYDRHEYEPALQDAEQALTHIGPESGLYVQTFQLIAFVEERRGNFEAAFRARRKYAEVKTRAAGARLDADEYREILQEYERRIDEFLRDARQLAAVVEERERDDFDEPEKVQLQMGGLRPSIVEFCKTDSYSSVVYARLGPKFLERYRTFCGQLAEYRAGRQDTLSLAQVMDATEIFYQAATADANLLNIVFFNLRKANLFNELYDRYAVYYHRRKVEIVQERNRHQVEWQKNRFRLLQNLEGFVQDEDPFDEGAFNEILNGYGTALPFAREFGDLAMIYGASYALIQRSLEREALYDSLLEEGVFLPDDSLQKKKEAILRDLKTADYHLQYILYVDPAHVDAYLLRGWLYEYLEYRRGLPLKRKPSFFDRAINFVSFTTAPAESEGDFYANSFDAYFPDRLYEENVDWYRQALDRLALRGGRPAERAALHLNLANNYFHLLNFQRALENYEIALKLGGRALFNDYRQEAVFHYNRGRSLYYEGRPRQAAAEFQKAYELYEFHERKPLHRQYSDLVFALQGSGRSAGTNWNRRQQILAREIDAARTRLALLAALIGLSRWEAGQHDAAIQAYRDARRRLYDDAAGDEEQAGKAQTDALSDTALLNFIALAFQNKRDLVASDEHARDAAERARARGLKRDDKRYRPGSVGGRMLGCFISYGEDFSVIGEGRNPYGFSPLRHYHLALGIQLENMILRGDLEGARDLLKKRRDAFEEHDGDVQLGQVGAINTLNQEALTRFIAGDFEAAATMFLKAADRARDIGSLNLFERNFYNHFHALFARFERDPPPARDALNRIGKARTQISEFRASYRERAKTTYVEQKQIENPEFEYREEIDDRILDDRVRREIVEAEAIQATLSYYAGYFGEETARNGRELEGALADYRRSADRFAGAAEALGTQFGADSLAVFRVRINRAQALAGAGRLLRAREELEDLAEKSFEFNLGREDWEVRWRLARVLEQIAERYEPADDRRNALGREIREHLDRALRSAERDRPDPPTPDGPIEEFYDFAAGYYVRTGAPDKALRVLEKQWERYLRQEYARFPLSFDDPTFNANFQKYRSLRQQIHALDRAEQELRLRRRDIAAVAKQSDAVERELAEIKRALLKERPAHRPFIEPAGELRPALGRGQILLRLFRTGDRLAVWKFRASAARPEFFTLPIEQDDAAGAVRRAFEQALEGESTSPVLVVDHRLYALPLEELQKAARPDLPPPRFAARVRADHRPLPADFPRRDLAPSTADSAQPIFFTYNQSRLERDPREYDRADLIVAPQTAQSSGVFTVSRAGFPFREWPARPRRTAAVFFETDGKDAASDPANTQLRREYRRRAAAFEVLRSTGAGTMGLGAADRIRSALEERGRRPYPRAGLRIFGAPGPALGDGDGDRMRMGRTALDLARADENKNHFDQAARLYDLADSLFGREARSEPEFDARLGALRAGLRDRVALSGAYPRVDEIEKDYPERRNRLRTAAVEALYLAGRGEDARAFLKKYPAQFRETSSPLLEFLNRLTAPVYAGGGAADFATDFAQARSLLLRGDRELEYIDDFLRHARHQAAQDLLKGLAGQRGRPAADIARWQTAVALDAHLLLPRRFRRPAYSADLPFALRRFLAPLHGRQTKRSARTAQGTETAGQDTEPDDRLNADPTEKFRAGLVAVFAAHAAGDSFDPADLGNVALGGGRTAYGMLDRLERAALFRLLIASLRNQPRGDTAARLRALLRVEARYGRERGAWMNLAAARAYLDIEEPAAALTFYREHLALEQSSIPDRHRRIRSAGLGLALISAGIAPDLKVGRATLERTLLDAGAGEPVTLYRLLSAEVSPAALAAFGHGARAYWQRKPGATAKADILLGVQLLKHRARAENRAAELLNLAVWEEKLRLFAPRTRAELPELSDWSARLVERIPTNQAFIALIDAGGSLLRVRLHGRKLAVEELPQSAIKLRRDLAQYLREAYGGRGDGETDRVLSRLYRSFVAAGRGQLTYYWSSGVHALAPLNLERGDRIFQIMDLPVFVDRGPRKLNAEYRNDFGVRLLGRPAVGPSGPVGFPGLRQARLTMERIALGQTGTGPPFHRNAYEGAGEVAARPPGAYFFVPAPPDRGNLRLPALLRHQARVRENLAREFTGPGVYTVHRALGQAHPFFLKYFYSRATPIPQLHDRLINAYFHQKRRYREEYHLYGYHLATTCPLVP